MVETNVKIESYFPTSMGYGWNTELANHYLPIIKGILNEQADESFFWKGKTTHNQDDFRLADHPKMDLMKEFVWEVNNT